MTSNYFIRKYKHFTKFSGTGSKNAMKEHAMLQDTEPRAFLQYFDANSNHNFTYFQNWERALKHLPFFDGRRYINELILYDRPCRPHLDIEDESGIFRDEKYLQDLQDELKIDIIHIFEVDYKKKITHDDIYIVNGCGMKGAVFKLSFFCEGVFSTCIVIRINW